MKLSHIVAGVAIGLLGAGHILWVARASGRSFRSSVIRALLVFVLVQAPLLPEWLRANDRDTQGSLFVVWLCLLVALVSYHRFTSTKSSRLKGKQLVM
jgi:ABC-type uncharacterized transport system permease subunit